MKNNQDTVLASFAQDGDNITIMIFPDMAVGMDQVFAGLNQSLAQQMHINDNSIAEDASIVDVSQLGIRRNMSAEELVNALIASGIVENKALANLNLVEADASITVSFKGNVTSADALRDIIKARQKTKEQSVHAGLHNGGGPHPKRLN